MTEFLHMLIQYLVNAIVFGIIGGALCIVLILRLLHRTESVQTDRDALAVSNAPVREA